MGQRRTCVDQQCVEDRDVEMRRIGITPVEKGVVQHPGAPCRTSMPAGSTIRRPGKPNMGNHHPAHMAWLT
jgi:hypothetical protein